MPIFIDVFHEFYGTAIVPTFIDIVPFLINIVPTYNLFLFPSPTILTFSSHGLEDSNLAASDILPRHCRGEHAHLLVSYQQHHLS